MAFVATFAKNQAGKVKDYVYARALHEYNEAALNVETQIYLFKDWLNNSFAVKTYAVQKYAAFGKSFNDYRKKNSRNAAADAFSKGRIKVQVDGRGRIGKNQSTLRNARTFARSRQLWDANGYRAPQAHRTSQSLRTPQAQPTPVRKQKDCSKMPCVHYTLPPPKPKLSYEEEMCLKYPQSEDPQEREERKRANMARIKAIAVSAGYNPDAPFTPSGHSGIEDSPILLQWKREQQYHEFMSLRDEYLQQQRRQQEECRRKAQEADIIRTKKAVLLEQAGYLYDNRVLQLASYGRQIDFETSKLLTALDNSDMSSLEQAIIALVNDVIEPARAIYDAMSRKIALESLGAQTLKNEWPVANIDKVLDTFNAPTMSSFNDSFQASIGYMLQGLRDICQPITVAAPFINSLLGAPAQPFVAAPLPFTLETFVANAQRRQTGNDSGAGKSFGSFAELAKAAARDKNVPSILLTPPSAPSGSGSGFNSKATGVFK